MTRIFIILILVLMFGLQLLQAAAAGEASRGVCRVMGMIEPMHKYGHDGDAREAQGWEGCGGVELYGVSWWESGFAR